MATRSYKYELKPNKGQEMALLAMLGLCRELYNAALQERRDHYKRYRKGISYGAQSAALREIKAVFPEYKALHSQVVQNVLVRLDLAFQGFFRRHKAGEAPGFPRYKSKNSYNSLTFPQIKINAKGKMFGGVNLQSDRKRLSIHGIGDVKIIFHREMQGKVKTCTVKKSGNKWFAVFVCTDVPARNIPKIDHKTSGLDLGITNFITLSDGQIFDHPRPLKKKLDALAKVQSQRDKAPFRSKRRKKLGYRLKKIHEKIANIRQHVAHAAANQLAKTHDLIILEDLQIDKMKEKAACSGQRTLARSIGDVSWGVFLHILTYKAEEAGTKLRFVNPANTSKTCCRCGNIKANLELWERKYKCSCCGNEIDRDLNAARNIKQRGLNAPLRSVQNLGSGTEPLNISFIEAPP